MFFLMRECRQRVDFLLGCWRGRFEQRGITQYAFCKGLQKLHLRAKYIASRGGTFYKMLGLYLRFHARFIHATLIGVMLNFWKVGVTPTTPLYTKIPPLIAS